MSEYNEMFENMQNFFAALEKDVFSKITDNELQEQIKTLIKSDFQDANFLNMIATKMKAKGENIENIKDVSDLIKKRVEDFHPTVKYLEVDKKYLS